MKGKITELKQNEKNFFFKIEGDARSFSGFGQAEVEVGDTIEFELVVNGKYNNAKDILVVVESYTPAPAKVAEYDPEQLIKAAELAVVMTNIHHQVWVAQSVELIRDDRGEKAQSFKAMREALGLGA